MRGCGPLPLSRLLSELWRKSVYVHLVILVVGPWPHRTFNHLTHGVDRLAFPDADAEAVIVGSSMDWQRNMGWKPSLECLGLSGLKAIGVMDSVDDCDKHGLTVPSSGDCGGNVGPIVNTPDSGALRCIWCRDCDGLLSPDMSDP